MTTVLWSFVAFCSQAIVIVYPPVLVFWLVIHLNIKGWRRIGKRAYWTACLAWPAISGPMLYWRTELFSLQWQSPWWMIALGIIALGMAFRIGSEARKSISWRALVGLVELEPQRNPQPLLQSGIYAKTRNPVYAAHWLAIFAFAALTGFAANWLLLAVDSIVLPLMVRAEERELRERYGAEYDEYVRRVRRFAPLPPW
jgi:protein-S-isoprenylcysteine O-methyltransferase Ste14